MSFKEAIKNVQGKGKYDEDEAAAIVANASRNASPAAKKANPKLAKVKGGAKGQGPSAAKSGKAGQKAKAKGKPAPNGKPASNGKPAPKGKPASKCKGKPASKCKGKTSPKKRPSFGQSQGFGNPFA